jgi:hypothetical protein
MQFSPILCLQQFLGLLVDLASLLAYILSNYKNPGSKQSQVTIGEIIVEAASTRGI